MISNSLKKMRLIYNKREKIIPKDAVYVGRGSIWGNPYKIGEILTSWDGKTKWKTTREHCINTYKLYLDAVIKQRPYMRPKLMELDGKPLVCYCYPKDCHARIIIEKIQEIKKEKRNTSSK